MTKKNKYFNTFNKGDTTMTDKKNDAPINDSELGIVTTPATTQKLDLNTTPVVQKTQAKLVADTIQTKKEIPNTNVDKMKKLVENFESAVRQNDAKNNKFPGIDAMISMCEFLNRTNDPAVFEFFFKYYMKNQEGTMFYTTAMCGIHTIQNKVVKTRVSATNSVFQELARVRGLKKGTFHFTFNSMKLLCIGEPLAKWVISKASTRQ